ncbi:MAG: 3'-5' exonuclease [Opitutales bacterium]
MSNRSATDGHPILPSRISKAEINQLPLVRFSGKTQVIHDTTDLRMAAEKLRSTEVLGFDIECKPTFRKGESNPAALLQLATGEEAFLIQLHSIQDLGPIGELLEDTSIAKTGVALRDDIRKLAERHPFQAGNFVELGLWATKLGIITTGLRSLTAIFLKQRVSKGAQLSNWERSKLSRSQISYAATDAWISRKLHLVMQRHILKLEQETSK